ATLEPLAFRAVTDEAKSRVDTVLAEAFETVEHVVGALHCRHSSDPTDGELVCSDAEVTTCLVAAVGIRHAFGELDTEADDGEFLPRRDAEAHEIVAHL